MRRQGPTNIGSIGRGKAGRLILIILLVLVLALAGLLYYFITPTNYGHPGLQDGQYYERDKTLKEQADSASVRF